MAKKTNKKNEDLKKGLLQKKISELTKQDIASLQVNLGTSPRPYPMFGTVVIEEDGHQSQEQRLSSVKDSKHPMKIYSERPYNEVVGMMYRDMPTPSMLSMQKSIMEMLEPDSNNRICLVLGDPGAGKSFAAGAVGRVQSERGADIFDCGGKNMNDVLFEMVLDFGTSDALPVAIDKRIQAHALQDLSYAMLKNNLPSKYIEETEDKRLLIDWEGLKTAGTKDVEKTYETLSKVSNIEGLSTAGGNSLGMNTQYGRAITKFINGELDVWDEYNKSKEGTDNALQTFLQFANNEIDECTVTNTLKNKDDTSGPSEFTFKREDVKLGWGIIMTGNNTDDGTTTRSLNKSVYSRLRVKEVAKPELRDWQHFICRILTGVPISTLHTTFRKFADEKPDEFGEMLLHWRKTGLSDDEKNNIPQHEVSFIKNWQKVLGATEKMAEYYKGWAELTDYELAPMKDGNLVEEIDEEYQKKVSIDFRKVIQHIQYALPIRSKMSTDMNMVDIDMDPSSWESEPAEAIEVDDESLERNFGTRWTDYMADQAYETSGAVAKPVLYGHLKSLMKECGLKDMHLQEGAHSSMKSVESSLNISLFDTTDLSEEVLLAQEMFCNYLREKDANITSDNDSIITVAQMTDVLAQLEEQEEDENNSSFVIPNSDLATLDEKPFMQAEMLDMANDKTCDDNQDFDINTLVDHDAFMMTLAFPKAGKQNLQAIWDQNNNIAVMSVRVDSFKKRAELEDEIEELEGSPEKSDEVIEKQKELLALLKEEKLQIKSMGGDVDDVEEDISNLKGVLESQGVALEDDVSQVPLGESILEPDEAVKIAENNSDTGIGATSIVVKAANENGEMEATSIHIIVNNNSEKMLIVGGEVSDKLSSLFREVSVVHVDSGADNAKALLSEALGDILRGVPEDTKEYVKEAMTYRNDPVGVPDHEIDVHKQTVSLDEVLLSYEPYLAKYIVPNKSSSHKP